MTSTTEQVSRLTIWIYRSLALGSTIAVGLHIAPLMENASVTHAIELSRSKESFFATSGVRRMTSNAQKSEQKRQKLKEHGALAALSECVNRDDERLRQAALHAVALIAKDDLQAIARERGLRDALSGEICSDGCQAVWQGLGMEQAGVAERKRLLQKFQERG